MSKQILLHNYYYSFAFNQNCINAWENFFIYTDIEDPLSVVN